MTDDSSVLAALEEEFEQTELPPNQITSEMMYRRLVWDCVPHDRAQTTIADMELPGVSEDVENREHDEAHMRENEFSPLIHLVAMLSQQVAAVQLITLQR